MPALLAAALVVAAAAGGVGFGHLAWPGTVEASGSPVAASHGSAPTSVGGDSGSAGGSTGQGDGGDGAGNGSLVPGGPATGGNGTGDGGSGGLSGNGGNGGISGNGGNGSGGNGAYPPNLLPNGQFPNGELPNGLLPGQGNGSGGRGGRVGGSTTTPGTITSAPGAPDDISGILKKVEPFVVDIDDTFAYQEAAGAGTGIVLTKTGEIVTNNHVIDGATSISVTDLGNGKTYAATVVGYDPSSDVAVLQLKGASDLVTAPIGNSASLAVGDAVVGIGNAGGVGGTPSAAGGSVTATNRSISVGDELYGTTSHLSGLIEVNSAIQSGDSGGPLVTSDGSVVGMDTAASEGPARSDGAGEGFAIPIATALSIAKTIESGSGSATIHVGPTAALGVLVSTDDQSGTQEQFPGQLGGSDQAPVSGAQVAGVIDGGAAAAAGLQAGDVITSLGGHTIDSSATLSTLMTTYKPGQSVKVGWTDVNGQTHTANLTLGTGPAA